MLPVHFNQYYYKFRSLFDTVFQNSAQVERKDAIYFNIDNNIITNVLNTFLLIWRRKIFSGINI